MTFFTFLISNNCNAINFHGSLPWDRVSLATLGGDVEWRWRMDIATQKMRLMISSPALKFSHFLRHQNLMINLCDYCPCLSAPLSFKIFFSLFLRSTWNVSWTDMFWISISTSLYTATSHSSSFLRDPFPSLYWHISKK